MLPLPPRHELPRRLGLLIPALIVVGIGVALTVDAGLGLGPWDVLHQGLATRLGLPIGAVGILVGLAVLAAWPLLGVRFGIGTVINVILIGVTIDVTLAVLPTSAHTWSRWAALGAGDVLIGVGAGAYIAAGLGTGPRDGVMTGLATRGWSVRSVRTAMEITVLAAGWAMGGTVGIGTVLIAVTIGPIIQASMAWFGALPMPAAPALAVAPVES